MSVALGRISDEAYVEIDGVPYPLVRGSMLQRSPLNPFSPATGAGNTARVTDARLAVQVWDDFTGGLGQREEESADSHSFSEGNLDIRLPGFTTHSPPATLLATLVDHTTPTTHVETMAGSSNLFIWNPRTPRLGTVIGGVYAARPNGYGYGFTVHNNLHIYIVIEQSALNDTKVYRTSDFGATWNVVTLANKWCRGLAAWDNVVLTYDMTNKLFLQSLDGVTWTTHSAGPLFLPGEELSYLVPWVAPGGSRDTMYATTNRRILVYEEESAEWHTFWNFTGVFKSFYSHATVFRRDNNLYFTPYSDPTLSALARGDTGAVMMFGPGTSDAVEPEKRFGLSASFITDFFRLQGGIHWLYGFADGTPGGIFAMNEFQGWSHIFDPRIHDATNPRVVGGGYGEGYLYAVLAGTGKLYQIEAPDRRLLPPRAGSVHNTNPWGDNYLRSSWVSQQQKNRWKVGAFFEVDFVLTPTHSPPNEGVSGLPGNASYSLRYRVDNGTWVTLGPFTNASVSAWPHRLTLPANGAQTGLAYKHLQWEVITRRDSSVGVNVPVLASVALYYSYWQENHSAYQFAVDLSHETWAEYYPDGAFGPYTRGELQLALLALNDTKGYHTLKLYSGEFEETIGAVDLLVAGREDADSGGGVYSVTARDQEAT